MWFRSTSRKSRNKWRWLQALFTTSWKVPISFSEKIYSCHKSCLSRCLIHTAKQITLGNTNSTRISTQVHLVLGILKSGMRWLLTREGHTQDNRLFTVLMWSRNHLASTKITKKNTDQ